MSDMNTTNTTNIHDLPTDPLNGGGNGNNIGLSINEVNNQPQQSTAQFSLDQQTISQIVSGLQQASSSGATQLPSRDIPLQTNQLTNDEQIHPNYIPQTQNDKRDYINENMLDNIEDYYNAETRQNSLDVLYDEIQAPLLLAVLYFLFQLPFFKKNVFKYLPILCNTDGNYNLNGLIFTCCLFGFIYYSLSKTVKKMSKF